MNSALDRYLETEVMTADPMKLVRLLYRGAIEAIGGARSALKQGDAVERSRLIMKAWSIVTELRSSLDPKQAPELSRNLSDLYIYIAQRLLGANMQQADAPLAESESLLATLAEAWDEIAAKTPAAPRQREPVDVAY